MGTSHRASVRTPRSIQQLVQECVRLGQDPLAWNRHMLTRLLQVLGGSVATVLKIVPDHSGQPAAVFGMDVGWSRPQSRRTYFQQFVAGNGFRRTPTFRRLMALEGVVVARTRRQLIADRSWYRSAEFCDIRQPLGLDDLLIARLRKSDRGTSIVIIISRQLAYSPFTCRESRLLDRFGCQLVLQLGQTLTLNMVGLYNGLSHQLQATLSCLLKGDSEQQAAGRLGLSRFTLHEYVGNLYRHFGVSSRPELLARCYRHGGWADLPVENHHHARLPARLQQTLERLLDGDSEKQVAMRLRLSQNTIHEYVTSLYRHFRVHSRAQLLIACGRGNHASSSAR